MAVGKREKLYVFGTDYPTADGTGVRDYIHVSDLADAHIQALTYLRNRGTSATLNCGYGHGYSVREVIDAVNKVNGTPIPVEEMPRRPGDPPQLVAAVDKIHDVLDWKPRYDDLHFIVKTSLDWERKLIEHPWGELKRLRLTISLTFPVAFALRRAGFEKECAEILDARTGISGYVKAKPSGFVVFVPHGPVITHDKGFRLKDLVLLDSVFAWVPSHLPVADRARALLGRQGKWDQFSTVFWRLRTLTRQTASHLPAQVCGALQSRHHR